MAIRVVMRCQIVWPIVALVLQLRHSTGFCVTSDAHTGRAVDPRAPRHRLSKIYRTRSALPESANSASSDLLQQLQYSPEENARKIRSSIDALEQLDSVISEDDTSRFEPLIGLYNVSFVQTIKEGENPVGGKWTRKSGLAQQLLRTRRTLQHVLSVNSTGIGAQLILDSNSMERSVVAEAVNVIALEALWGKIRATIILRGDCIALNTTERIQDMFRPLSPLAVRVLFDAPRIVFGRTGRWFNFNIGPKSSVVLDTCYVDDKVRIGVGGRSGTRFVFARCKEDDSEASEFRGMLIRRAWGKLKILSALSTFGAAGLYASLYRGWKIFGSLMSVASLAMAVLIAFSSGGIEQNDASAQQARKQFQ